MPGRQQYPSFLIKLICGILSLLLLAAILQHSSEVSVSTVNAVHDIATQLHHDPAPSKIGIPFGNKAGFQAIDLLNATFSVHEPYLPVNANELRRRISAWEQALSEGKRFLSILDGPRTQAELDTYEQLQFPGGGWVVSVPGDDYTTSDFTDAYNALGLHLEDGRAVYAELTNSYSNCKRSDWPSRGGEYGNIYNIPGKIIVATTNWGPTFELKHWASASNMDAFGLAPYEDYQLKDMLSRINRWSDIVWMVWSHLAGASAGQLEYVFRHDVQTDESLNIMVEAASRAGAQGGHQMNAKWPGIPFAKGTDGFQAILGTPHGKGVVYLLVQHPNQLATKNILSITVFSTPPRIGIGSGPRQNLLFKLTA